MSYMIQEHLVPGFDIPAPKAFRHGTHRSTTPEATVAKARTFMPAMGITRLANVTGLDYIGIPVVMACRPNSRGLAVSQGKGLTLAAARASAVMEAMELYHADHITLPLKLATYEELRYTHRVLDVTELAPVSESRFHPNLPLLWIEGHDLLQDERVWLPYEVVYTNYTVPPPPGSWCFAASSNGLASGNHLLEAISHGLCETVERDSTTLWNLGGAATQRATRLDLSTVDDPGCREVLDKYERAGICVAVWETTTDVGIPSFACRIADRSEDPFHLLYSAGGMGCHVTPEIALLRALTEAAQTRLTLIAGARDDCFRENYLQSRSLDRLREERAQIACEDGARRDFRQIRGHDGETFNEDVAWQLECLRAAGTQHVVVVDLTKAEFGLPVARVVIPGLEGYDQVEGYAPGPRARARLGEQA